MRLNQFYKKFEELTKEGRFEPIRFEEQPTSFFVLFQQLGEVRKQKRFWEEREAYLLEVAENAFNKKKNG